MIILWIILLLLLLLLFTAFSSIKSRLESKLCKLYKNMVCLKETLQNQCSSTTSAVLTSEHISQPIRDRLASHVTSLSDMLRDCSEDLLSLSVLYPAAPWVSHSVTESTLKKFWNFIFFKNTELISLLFSWPLPEVHAWAVCLFPNK